VTGERQRQLSEEATALKSWVFPRLDFKSPTDFPPIFADESEYDNFLRLAHQSYPPLRVYVVALMTPIIRHMPQRSHWFSQVMTGF
jgi:hypothetical protein